MKLLRLYFTMMLFIFSLFVSTVSAGSNLFKVESLKLRIHYYLGHKDNNLVENVVVSDFIFYETGLLRPNKTIRIFNGNEVYINNAELFDEVDYQLIGHLNKVININDPNLFTDYERDQYYSGEWFSKDLGNSYEIFMTPTTNISFIVSPKKNWCKRINPVDFSGVKNSYKIKLMIMENEKNVLMGVKENVTVDSDKCVTPLTFLGGLGELVAAPFLYLYIILERIFS